MRKWTAAFLISGLFVWMLCNSSAAAAGASAGLLLWYQNVLPNILPALILSKFLLLTGGDRLLTALFSTAASRFFGLSRRGTYACMIGLLCGYPAGVKTAADLRRQNLLSETEARALIPCLSFPSPMFLTGYIYAGLLAQAVPFWKIALSVYLPPFAALSVSARASGRKKKSTPDPNLSDRPEKLPFGRALDEILTDSCLAAVKIGLLMMLFSILTVLFRQLLPDLPLFQMGIGGVLEMTTGSFLAAKSTLSPSLKTTCIVFFICFGGLSVTAQSLSAGKELPLPSFRYLAWKLYHGLASALLFLLLS